MTKQEAITAMKEGKKVAHRYFLPHEWVIMGASEDGENIIKHEDGSTVLEDIFWELRNKKEWDIGWNIRGTIK